VSLDRADPVLLRAQSGTDSSSTLGDRAPSSPLARQQGSQILGFGSERVELLADRDFLISSSRRSARSRMLRMASACYDAIRAAQQRLWEVLRIATEPGAAALAALLSRRCRPRPGERVAVLLCGANNRPSISAGRSRPFATNRLAFCVYAYM
jgi:hypothetical protein